MNEKEKRKQVAKISVFITSIFVIFLSISYAFINQTLTGTKKQVITAGNLQLNLTEGDSITLENALPMYDEVGMLQEGLTFQLTNPTEEQEQYILRLIDQTPANESKLDISLVKYGLEKAGTKKIRPLSSIRNNKLDQGTIAGGETVSYHLRLWIDSTVQEEAAIKGKSLSYRIAVEVGQDTTLASGWSVMEERGTESRWEMGEYVDAPARNKHYAYTSSIIEVIFENEIYIPDSIDKTMIWDVSEAQDESVMSYLETINSIESEGSEYRLHIQGDGGVKANSDCTGLFAEFHKLNTINGLEYFDTSDVTNMTYMFFESWNLKTVDFKKLDTSKVTNMNAMFYDYDSPYPLDLSGLNTSIVTNMNSMFYMYGSDQPLDLSNFSTSNVVNMNGMFQYWKSEASLDISNFDFSKVTDKRELFYRSSKYYATPILVKDEAMKAWVLEQEPSLTNVTIKTTNP